MVVPISEYTFHFVARHGRAQEQNFASRRMTPFKKHSNDSDGILEVRFSCFDISQIDIHSCVEQHEAMLTAGFQAIAKKMFSSVEYSLLGNIGMLFCFYCI